MRQKDFGNSGINTYINILYKSWNDLLNHYSKLGEQGGYGHHDEGEGEADIRSLLFCKIFNRLGREKKSLLDVHAEVKFSPETKVDIVLGSPETGELGVEVKRHRNIEDDLSKLRILIKNGKIKAGACLSIVKRSWDGSSSRKLHFKESDVYRNIETTYEIADEDRGNNNFVKWKHIEKELFVGTPDYMRVDYDAIFLILRRI
jgi:hypothetical protein